MTGPRRLLDESSDDLALSLLRSWQRSAPAPGAAERAAVALGVAAATTAPPATAGAAAAGVATKAATTTQMSLMALGKWCAVGAATSAVVLGSGLAATTLYPADPDTGDRGVQAASQVPKSQVRKRPPSIRSASSAAQISSEPPAAVAKVLPKATGRPASSPGMVVASPRATQPRTPAEQEDAVQPPAVPEPNSIGWEIATLDHARRALADRDAAQALRLLDQLHQDARPQTFRPEALLLRIEALSAAGRSAEARALARQYLERYPSNPGSQRLRAFLASP